MADTVTLSSSIRSNLLTLQETGKLVNRTNARLSSEKKVGSAVDDAVAYFQAKSLSDRAADLNERKDNIDQGISSVKAAMSGLESIEKMLVSMKGVVLSAKAATNSERKDLQAQFNTLAQQITNLSNDTSYQGLNLVNSTKSSLTVKFSEKSTATLTITGVNANFSTLKTGTTGVAASIAGETLVGSSWTTIDTNVSALDSVIAFMDSAISGVRSNTKSLGTNVAMLKTRLDFTTAYAGALTEGSDKLTLADLNEEGANLVALQTRQQLGIQALSFAGQQEQGVLSLFR